MTLDSLEKLWFSPSFFPFETPINESGLEHPFLDDRFMRPLASVSLDGEWSMISSQSGDWTRALRAGIPCTIYTPLMEAGMIPDIYKEKNVDLAREYCFKSWRFRRTFTLGKTLSSAKLIFEGVANECTVWLDGVELGRHAGAFGGPDFELENLEAGEHLLEVLLDAIPDVPYQPLDGGDDFRCHEPRVRSEYRTMVTPLMNYGHHYVNLPTHGIWRSVRLEECLPCNMNVLAAPKDWPNAQRGLIDLFVTVEGIKQGDNYTLNGEITPWNFEGKSVHFETLVTGTEKGQYHFQVNVPDPQIWQPRGFGKPNLYQLRLRCDNVMGPQAYCETRFGIRTVEMEENRSRYCKSNWFYAWRFVINGTPMPIHGENWGMLDSAGEADEAKYRRMLQLAINEHCNMLRVWGNGVIEIDRFYELCDELGMMVFQEWPLSAGSHETRKLQLMHDTVVRSMLKLRNHPSIVIWCGGNELDYQNASPTHNGIRMLGRLAYELDGTRPFHISEDWGGSFHEYPVFWGGTDLEGQLRTKTVFLGEYGLATMPCYESVLQYLPESEKNVWPPAEGSVLRYHLPMFDNSKDFNILSRYIKEMMPLDSLEHFCLGSQLGQVVAIRHNMEFQRCNWPENTTGALHYKLNEMYPAASWGTVDFYTVPRMAHYFMENACRPQHACLEVSTFHFSGKAIQWPVYVLDDNRALREKHWKVDVSAYTASLHLIKQQTYEGGGLSAIVHRAGVFELDESQTVSAPLLVHVRMTANGVSRGTFYWFNFTQRPGGLMQLPPTTLKADWADDVVTIENTGSLPAVGVHFTGWEALRTGYAEESYLWLDPGEKRTVRFTNPARAPLSLACWNAPQP